MCFRNSWFDEVPTLMSDTTINHVKSTISDNDVKSIFLEVWVNHYYIIEFLN